MLNFEVSGTPYEKINHNSLPCSASGGPASLLIKLILYIILFIISIDYLIIIMPPAQITLLLPTGTLVDKLSIQCAEH